MPVGLGTGCGLLGGGLLLLFRSAPPLDRPQAPPARVRRPSRRPSPTAVPRTRATWATRCASPRRRRTRASSCTMARATTRIRQRGAVHPATERGNERLLLRDDDQRDGPVRLRVRVLHAAGQPPHHHECERDGPAGRLCDLPGQRSDAGAPRCVPDADGRRDARPRAREPGPGRARAGELAGRRQLSRHQHHREADPSRGVAELFLYRRFAGEGHPRERVSRGRHRRPDHAGHGPDVPVFVQPDAPGAHPEPRVPYARVRDARDDVEGVGRHAQPRLRGLRLGQPGGVQLRHRSHQSAAGPREQDRRAPAPGRSSSTRATRSSGSARSTTRAT